MKRIFTRILYAMFTAFAVISTTFAQVNVSTGGAPTSYPTLKDAFDAINAGTHTGTISIDIAGNTTETATAMLQASGTGGASYGSITIQPLGGAARSISANIGGHLIQLNGAGNVTIDGLNSAGNSLAIANTNAGSSATTIAFTNDATYNTVNRCSVQGSSGSILTFGLGVVDFGGGTTTGNDFNTVSNCNIGPAGANLPICCIYSMGTSAVINNSQNTIAGNKIFDYFNAGASTSGMNINSNNAAWTITGNRLYQTATRVYTTASTHYGIFITSGDGYTISDNVLGYADASGNGTTNIVGLTSGALGGTFPTSYIVGGAANGTKYVAISGAFAAGGTVSSIQNNTIAGYALYTSSSTSGTLGVFCGIAVNTGNVNIGTIAGNTIGTPASSIYTACTSSGGAICGIYVTSGNTVNIQNNILQNLDAMGTTATTAGSVNPINVEGAGATVLISGNTIGNAVNPNLRTGNLTTGGNLSNTGTTFGTASGTSLFQGIRNTNTGSITIGTPSAPNIIRNVAVNSTAGLALYRGIYSTTGTVNISYNTINNITAPSGGVSYSNGGLAGIGILIGGGSPVISNNTIGELSLTNIATSGYTLGAIVINAPTGPLTISKNKIFGLSNASTGTSVTVPPTVTGIFFRNAGGVTTVVDNNMISLGSGQSTNTTFVGIWPQYNTSTATTISIYHNTVNIEGNVGSGALPSMCLHRGDFSTTTPNTSFTIDAKNNLFSNTRSGGTGRHFAIANNYGAVASTIGWGANATNYNILNGNAATIGYWSGDQTFAGWQAASACDGNSYSGIPVIFGNTATGDLHVNMGLSPTRIESSGTTIAGITTDIDGDTRPGPTGSLLGGAFAPDLGADEIDAVPFGLPLGVSGTPVNASCPGASDGSITILANGGQPPYGYAWSNGQTTAGLSGIPAGSYTVTVTDAVNATATGSWTIATAHNICPTISVAGNVTTTTCYNATQVIYVSQAPDTFTVQVGGDATFIAGERIIFYPGTLVLAGGNMVARISGGTYCGGLTPTMPAVISGDTEPQIQIERGSFTVYPNPAGGNITIAQKGELPGGVVTVEIYNMRGAKVIASQMTGVRQQDFGTSDLPAGLYFIRLVAGDHTEIIKLIKTR